MKKFICVTQCGKCCEHLRGKNVPPDLAPRSKRLRKKGFYTLLSPEDCTIPLFEWEKQLMESEAKETGILVKISPSFVMRDALTNTYVGLEWNLEHDNCPFLAKDKKCRIYPNRPLICRTFPIVCPTLEPPRFFDIARDWCPGWEGIPEFTSDDDFSKAFGRTQIVAMNRAGLVELLQTAIVKAFSKHLFSPATDMSRRRILKDIRGGARVEGFMRFSSSRDLFRWTDFQRVLTDVYERDAHLFRSLTDEMPYF